MSLLPSGTFNDILKNAGSKLGDVASDVVDKATEGKEIKTDNSVSIDTKTIVGLGALAVFTTVVIYVAVKVL